MKGGTVNQHSSSVRHKMFAIIIGFVVVTGFVVWRNKGVMEENSFIVGVCAEYKPYEFKNKKGTIVGFDVDLSRKIAERLEKNLVLRNMSFDALILALKKGEIDTIISAMAITHERLQSIDMVPYHGDAVSSLSLIFHNTIPNGISSINDLRSLKSGGGTVKPIVGVQTGTFQATILNNYDFIEPRVLDTSMDLVMDLRHGKSHAMLFPHEFATALRNEYGDEFVSIEVPLKKDEQVFGHGIGILKSNKELYHAIQEIVTDLRATGFIEKLHHHWFGAK